jgi:hypothetical protein
LSFEVTDFCLVDSFGLSAYRAWAVQPTSAVNQIVNAMRL